MDRQHYLLRFVGWLKKYTFEHLNNKIHGSEIIVMNNYIIFLGDINVYAGALPDITL